MDCDDLAKCQKETPEKFTACVDDDCHHCGDCFKSPETPEAAVPLNDLLNGGPWPLKDVLNKLVEATNILLNDYDYDGHGWEQINAARDKAVEITKTI